MQKYTNAALYNVDLEGKDCGEFDGEHPTLVFRTKMEKDVYIAVPFTTYTKERWEKSKKHMCCRVKSTGSIAKIDKVQIITVNKIRNRWRENGKLLIPSKEDIETIIAKVIAYYQASLLMGLHDYVSVNREFELFMQEFDDAVVGDNISKNSSISIDFSNSEFIRLIFDSCMVRQLSIQELYDISNNAFGRQNYKIFFSGKNVSIDVMLTSKRALTLKDNYDILNVTEG